MRSSWSSTVISAELTGFETPVWLLNMVTASLSSPFNVPQPYPTPVNAELAPRVPECNSRPYIHVAGRWITQCKSTQDRTNERNGSESNNAQHVNDQYSRAAATAVLMLVACISLTSLSRSRVWRGVATSLQQSACNRWSMQHGTCPAGTVLHSASLASDGWHNEASDKAAC